MADDQDVVPTPLRSRRRTESPAPVNAAKLKTLNRTLTYPDDDRSVANLADTRSAALPIPGTVSPITPVSNPAAVYAPKEADAPRAWRPSWSVLVNALGVILVVLGSASSLDREVCFKLWFSITAMGSFPGDRSNRRQNCMDSLALVPRLAAPRVNGAAMAAPLLEKVTQALDCTSSRSAILDILAGAPYEFSSSAASEEAFYRLPRLAASAGTSSHTASVETELRDTVFQLASVGGGWPPAVKTRIVDVLKKECVAETTELARNLPLELELDAAYTTNGLSIREGVGFSSSWLHRVLIDAAARSGLHRYQARAALYRSRPAAVVLGLGPPAVRDCFAVRGNASVSLRIAADEGARVHEVALIQPSRWLVPSVETSPRRFAVYGEPAHTSVESAPPSDDTLGPYTLHLGSFEYLWASTSTQTFALSTSRALNGLRFVFERNQKSDGPMCIYRLRAFGVPQ